MAEDSSSKKFLKDFKHTLKHGKDDLSLVQLGSQLGIEESLKAQDSDKGKGKEVAGPSVNVTEEGGKNKHHKQNKGKKRSNENNSGSRSNKKPKLECWKCGKTGHFKRDCRSGKKNNTNVGGSGKGSKDQSQDQDQNLVDAIAWWIDSGATTHVCKDRRWFKTYEPVEDGSVLYMGDDHFAHVHGKGSVALEFSSGKTITLFNVLYVPKLCKNLVSGPMLNKCGYKQVYESDKYILSKSGVFVGFGYYNNGMFMLNLNKVPDDSDSVYMSSYTVLNSSLWHARLGHVHYKRMLEMSKDDLIPGIDENLKKCTTCMLTKITRKPFQSITRKSVILELIHSDLCDFHATPYLGNKKYVITFLDDASRFCYVYLLHAKDKALDKFRIYKIEVELQQNDLVKTLRADRGGEYYDLVFFQSVGIIYKTTTPYTPQQNDVAKRKNRAIKEMKFGYTRNINNVRAKEGVTTSSSKSYVHAVKVKNMFGALECDYMPSIVLDDECLIFKDLSKALLERVKEFAPLPNLKIVLKNEGFAEIKIQYMGEFWVLLEFPSSKTKELFQEHMRVGSWFSVLKKASSDFIPEGIIVWVEIEGVPFKLWSKNTFKRIAAKWGELLDVDDQKGRFSFEKVFLIRAKEVPGWVPEFVDDSDDDDESDNGFKDGDAKVQDGGSCGDDSDENKDKSKNIKPSDHSLKYPPGFTPNGDNNEFCMHEENVRSVNEANSLNCNMEEYQNGQERNNTNKGSKEEISGSVCSGLAQKVKKDWVKELCIKNKVNFLAIQETKLENMDLWCVKACWGNYAFDFVHSDSVGNSGGILCIWDPISFRKNNVTVSGYFCMVRGVWLKTGVDILMVVVYAPQELRDKRILWDYWEHVINQWDGEVVIIGDFNEVRFKCKRFGSIFNVQGVNVFNVFIANAGLEEVPLGGSSFTWCHKSATKMSKLDRFLISANSMISCPNISAISLDRYLSDHRPILLRESQHDYGPIPFRFFNHWLELDDFNKFVTDMWNLAPIDESNAMRNMDLKCAVSKEELKRAVWECGTDKSPGPDGFSFDIPNGCNSCFVALIPKVPDANLVKDFRPISLIGNGPFILNEVIQWCKLKKKQSLIFKVDFEKAYDSVRWDFLDDVLKKFGFANKWCAWIQRLKQGDPLSSFLFILIMESLHLSFQRVVDVGMFKGINLNPLVNLYHMFYTDDAVFVGQWCDGNINTLVHVFECFYQAPGLRINMCKSKILRVNVGDEKVKYAASKLGCLILNTPFSYLGTKVGGNMSRVQAWTEVVDKKGGLGVSSLYVLNRALMMKWVWRLYSQKESLWARVIKAIYGDDRQAGKVSKPGSRSCWRNIVNEVRILSNQGIKALDYMRTKLGNGESTAFQDDNWIDGKVLNIRGGVEQVQFNELSDMLQTVSLIPYSDRWVLSLEGSEEFSVASIRKIIDDNRLSTVDTMTLWIKCVSIF
uniref:Zinc finger, CCHC-type n=1 Tax=Tanacetum cinerariifolium TaxID=118510 RepID=A0A6L2MPV3_TANCI|nr:zinc finger, CCHC-type [Tanacetum cinerariifolium]